MARHKGARSDNQVDRDYPHQVEIEIPELGLGKLYSTMDAFARAFSHATRGIGKLRIERGRDGMRWCFTDPAHADDFQKQFFGGERITARWWR
jgi:hypothetical protein